MKEWCFLHPWMTFFIIIFAIWSICASISKIFKGKKRFMENLDIDSKGGIKMPDKNTNNKGSNTRPGNSNNGFSKQRGSQSVTPTSSSAPPPPPKQK